MRLRFGSFGHRSQDIKFAIALINRFGKAKGLANAKAKQATCATNKRFSPYCTFIYFFMIDHLPRVFTSR